MAEPLIPLFDIRLNDGDIAAVEETLRSGWLTMGPRTERFERAFAEHLGARHAVARLERHGGASPRLSRGRRRSGDEVIVPAITFVATANAVRYCGATPVLADIRGPHDLGIDPRDVEAKITARTKAVCVVHYAGYAGAVRELRALCDRARASR